MIESGWSWQDDELFCLGRQDGRRRFQDRHRFYGSCPLAGGRPPDEPRGGRAQAGGYGWIEEWVSLFIYKAYYLTVCLCSADTAAHSRRRPRSVLCEEIVTTVIGIYSTDWYILRVMYDDAY